MKPPTVYVDTRSLTTEEAEESPVLTATEAASYLKVSVVTIYRLRVRNEIPHKKVLGQYRFLKTDIDRWMKGDVT